MIVVDVNVIAYLMIAGDKTALAQRLFRQETDWYVPTLWQHEFLNVLATFVRHGGGRIDDAEQIWQYSLHLFGPQERSVNMVQALHLASQHNISAYDAQYIVLARTLQLPCITEDRRLLAAFPAVTQSMQTYLDARHTVDDT